jgi:hypothetical protein
VLERVDPEDQAGEGTRAAVVYRGFVHLPNVDLPVEVRVELPGGAATASFSGSGQGEQGGEGGEGARAKELLRMAAALVRSATKGATASGGAFPRKVERWRG